jgi:hypothetical protein
MSRELGGVGAPWLVLPQMKTFVCVSIRSTFSEQKETFLFVPILLEYK